MSLSERQCTFLYMLSELIQRSGRKDIKVIEFYRTKEQQEEKVKLGYSQTMNSKHLLGLAVDLGVIKDGKFIQVKSEYERLGAIWKSMNGVWGGSWKTLDDFYHFEIEP